MLKTHRKAGTLDYHVFLFRSVFHNAVVFSALVHPSGHCRRETALWAVNRARSKHEVSRHCTDGLRREARVAGRGRGSKIALSRSEGDKYRG